MCVSVSQLGVHFMRVILLMSLLIVFVIHFSVNVTERSRLWELMRHMCKNMYYILCALHVTFSSVVINIDFMIIVLPRNNYVIQPHRFHFGIKRHLERFNRKDDNERLLLLRVQLILYVVLCHILTVNAFEWPKPKHPGNDDSIDRLIYKWFTASMRIRITLAKLAKFASLQFSTKFGNPFFFTSSSFCVEQNFVRSDNKIEEHYWKFNFPFNKILCKNLRL